MKNRIRQGFANYRREIIADVVVELKRAHLTDSLLRDHDLGVATPAEASQEAPVVVSLTTYGNRIHDVFLVIESLMQQTVKADKIVLWLDEAEFSPSTIPHSLCLQQQRGLEIGYCPNLKSYKKLIPSLKKYPEAVIITVDDDVLYPHDFIERLVAAHRLDPESVWFNRGNLMRLAADGSPLPYEQWSKLDDNTNQTTWADAPLLHEGTPLAFPTGNGGVLYPPHVLDAEVMRDDLFMQLCPSADDIWFKLMTFKNGRLSRLALREKPFAHAFTTLPDHQDMALNRINIDQNRNDLQLKAVMEHYQLKLT